MDMKLQNRKQLELLLYKLLNDALLLWLIVFFFLLILEGAVPGYFSAYLSFTKMTIALFVLLALIAFLGRKNNISFEFANRKGLLKNKAILALLAVSLALIINSVRSLNIFEIIIISAVSFAVLLLSYKILIDSDK